MIASLSHLNDVMFSFYSQMNEREAGNKLYGPVQIASALSTNGTISAEHTFTFPEKTIFSNVFYLENGPLSAGTISLECAFVAGFTGTWAVLEARGFTGGTQAKTTMVSFNSGPFHVMRARVTANITGGTVDVWFVGA